MSTTDEKKQLVREMFETVWNEKHRDRIEEFYAEEFVGHGFGSDEGDLDEYRAWYDLVVGGFPDIHFEVGELFAEDDLVGATWTSTGTHEGEFMGIEPTDVKGEVAGISVSRVADGKITETWMNFDSLGLMQSIGAVPERPPASAD